MPHPDELPRRNPQPPYLRTAAIKLKNALRLFNESGILYLNQAA